MEDKVISFGKGIHREPSVGAVGELTDCVNLYSEGAEMKLMPRMEDVSSVPEGWTARFVHSNSSDYDHLVMTYAGEITVTSTTEDAQDGDEDSRDELTSGDVTTVTKVVVSEGKKTTTVTVFDRSKNVVTIGYNDFANTSNSFAEDVTTIVALGSNVSVKDITSMGNVLVVADSEKVNYFLWTEGEYKNYNFDELEDLDIQFALEGEYKAQHTASSIEISAYTQTGNEDVYNKDIADVNDVVIHNVKKADLSTDSITVLSGSGFISDPTQDSKSAYFIIDLSGKKYDANANYQISIQSLQKYVYGAVVKFEDSDTYYTAGHYGTGRDKNIGWDGYTSSDDNKETAYLKLRPTQTNDYTSVKFEGIFGQPQYVEKILLYITENGSELADADIVVSIQTIDEELTAGSALVTHTDENISYLISGINKFIKESSEDKNKFMFPFFVRYAIKLKDGTQIKPSSPILMLPNTTEVPSIYANAVMEDGKATTRPLISAVVAKLQYKIGSQSALDKIKTRKEVIESLIISVTAPIYSLDLSPDENDIRENFYCTSGVSNSVSYTRINTKDTSYKKYKLGDLDTESALTSGYRIIPAYYNQDKISENIESAAQAFRIVSEIDIDDENFAVKDDFTDVPMDSGTLSGLNGRSTLDDNAYTWKKYYSSCLYPYNNRLVMGNTKETMFEGYAPTIMTGYVNDPDATQVCQQMVEIEITKNNQTYIVRKNCSYVNRAGLLYFYYPDADAKSATLYRRWGSDEENPDKLAVKFTLSLKKHPYLNGAYWFNYFSEADYSVQTSFSADDYPDTSISTYNTNKLVASVLNDPFVIDGDTATLVGMGEIKKLTSNTKALSQGQFGQHPVLAFCSDGIWALAVGSDGKFTAVQPISRDVVNNVESITQTDSMVAFTSDKGLMVIDGSQVKQIGRHMDNVEKGVKMETLEALKGSFSGLFIDDGGSFVEMLKTCRLVYDDQNCLLWVMPEQETEGDDLDYVKQYAVHLENGEVFGYVSPAAIHSEKKESKRRPIAADADYNVYYGPVSVIPSYPHSYMQMKKVTVKTDGSTENCMVLAKFGCTQKDEHAYGWLMTRAIPFDNAFAMKMLYDMKVSKMFGTQSKATVAVFVSNDRVQWLRLKSMKARSYKWYRFVVFCDMDDYDRLTGLVCRIDERRTNKLR